LVGLGPKDEMEFTEGDIQSSNGPLTHLKSEGGIIYFKGKIIFHKFIQSSPKIEEWFNSFFHFNISLFWVAFFPFHFIRWRRIEAKRNL